MPGSNNFLPFNPGKVNQVSDTAYNASIYRSGGIPAAPSAAPSNIHNKLFYQVSMMVSAMAQMLANRGYAVNDTDLTALTAIMNSLAPGYVWLKSNPYNVGDIAYATSGMNNAIKRMECAVAGTSAATEPILLAVGTTIVDGSVTWNVVDIRDARNAATVGGKIANNLANNIALLNSSGQLTKDTTGNAASTSNIPTSDVGGNIWIA